MQIISSAKLVHAVRILEQGGVIAYPTEAVYGIGCLADRLESVARLLEIKHRPVNKGLILVASEFSQLEKYLQPVEDAVFKRIVKCSGYYRTWYPKSHDAF